MKTLRIMIVILIVITLVTMSVSCRKDNTSQAPATPNEPVPANVTNSNVQTTCPIAGGNINKSVYIDYQGKRIYFCCADCIATFNADPARYVKQMEDTGVVLKNTP